MTTTSPTEHAVRVIPTSQIVYIGTMERCLEWLSDYRRRFPRNKHLHEIIPAPPATPSHIDDDVADLSNMLNYVY